jgi:hypothetical protein
MPNQNNPLPTDPEPPIKDPQPYKDPVGPDPGSDVPMQDPVTPGKDLPKL